LVSALVLIVPYLQNWGGAPFARPDPDLMFSYQALVVADGRPPRDFTHTGYIYFLILSWWYQVLNQIGMLPVGALSALMESAHPLQDYAPLVTAGRALSMTLCALFSTFVFIAILDYTKDFAVALLAGVLFALGEGNAFQSIVLRTELLGSIFAFLAFFSLLRASATRGARWFWWLVLAGFCASVSYNVKVQLLFTLCALPILALAFGCVHAERRTVSSKQWMIGIVLLVPAGVAWVALLRQVGTLGPMSTFYIPAIAAYCFACTAIYRRLYKASRADHGLAVLAIVVGFGCGMFLLFLRYDRTLFVVDANPIEHMTAFVLQLGAKTDPQHLGHDATKLLSTIVSNVFGIVLGWDIFGSPYRLLIAVCVAGAAALALRGRCRPALQVALLTGLVVAQVAVHSIRIPASRDYWIISDPWIVFAFAVLLHEVRSALSGPWRIAPLTVGALVVGLVINRNVHVAMADWTQPKANICVQANGYLEPDVARIFKSEC
jgi:hypothetical protein